MFLAGDCAVSITVAGRSGRTGRLVEVVLKYLKPLRRMRICVATSTMPMSCAHRSQSPSWKEAARDWRHGDTYSIPKQSPALHLNRIQCQPQALRRPMSGRKLCSHHPLHLDHVLLQFLLIHITGLHFSSAIPESPIQEELQIVPPDLF